MKKYNVKLIKDYIETHKTELSCVLCGSIESWLGSATPVFCNNNYCVDLFKLNSRGMNETRTPYMQVVFNDGSTSYLMCGEEVF